MLQAILDGQTENRKQMKAGFDGMEIKFDKVNKRIDLIGMHWLIWKMTHRLKRNLTSWKTGSPK